jgi:hypothetical protein
VIWKSVLIIAEFFADTLLHQPLVVPATTNDQMETRLNGLDIILTKWISSGIIIAGDFNMLNISRVCSRFGLRKTVSAPTRGKNTLDQIATNMFNLFDSASYLPLLVDQTTSVFSLNQKII